MREALFIKKNKDRWNEISNYPSANTDEMADEFVQLTDDLGYAKTFYPHSNVTKFLNAEASKRYLAIYKNRREYQNKIWMFFKYDVPLAIAKHHVVVGLCFVLFIFFFFVGFYSSYADPQFVREILGNDYVNMTEKNIANGNPFGVYQSENHLLMFLEIMVNNIHVSFRFYVEGLLFPILTIPELFDTGIMVGSFDYMFYSKGLGGLFIIAVMIHGTLELTAITIASAAGIILGKSWMFPGTIKRIDSFKQGAKDSIKIIIGLVPIFMLAAFFEGFVTRYYQISNWLGITILSLSLVFIIGYFVVYPIKLKKKMANIG